MSDGLLSGVLPAIYSGSNTFKRKLIDALRNPGATLENMAGNAYDKTMRAGQMLADATAESDKALRSGANPFKGPASDRLAQAVMESYNPAGITVWHGSPHKFTKFDSSKIGTGEGAQAYGHGIYTAEAREVGEDYAKTLASPRNRVLDKRGVYVEPSPAGDGTWRLGSVSEVGKPRGRVGDATQGITDWRFPNVAAALRYAKKNGLIPKEQKPLLTEIASEGQYRPVRSAADMEDAAYNQLIASEPGYIYKIDLPDEHVARMLDWDKPLSQQPESVQSILNDELKRIGGSASTGERAYKELMFEARMQGNKNPSSVMRSNVEAFEASKRLRELGIPGIRYLDGGSRGTGQGTSNFVVFPGNEDMLKILEVNNQPIIEALRKKQ